MSLLAVVDIPSGVGYSSEVSHFQRFVGTGLGARSGSLDHLLLKLYTLTVYFPHPILVARARCQVLCRLETGA